MWKEIKAAGRQALIGLVGSKKVWTAVTSAIAAFAMRRGFDVDANTVGLVLTPLVGLIIGQAYQDRGKAAGNSTIVLGDDHGYKAPQ